MTMQICCITINNSRGRSLTPSRRGRGELLVGVDDTVNGSGKDSSFIKTFEEKSEELEKKISEETSDLAEVTFSVGDKKYRIAKDTVDRIQHQRWMPLENPSFFSLNQESLAYYKLFQPFNFDVLDYIYFFSEPGKQYVIVTDKFLEDTTAVV